MKIYLEREKRGRTWEGFWLLYERLVLVASGSVQMGKEKLYADCGGQARRG